MCSEFLPYEIKDNKRSCIYEVIESDWVEQVTRQRLLEYPKWHDWNETVYKHFVVSGHDNYYDIIASSFEEVVVPKNEAGDLIFLIEEY